MVGEATVQEPKAAGHTVSAVREQKVRKAGAHLAFPFVCSLGECAAHIQGDPSHSQLPQSRNSLTNRPRSLSPR